MRGGAGRGPSLRVLGVDPGTNATGWGVLEGAAGRCVYVGHGVVTPPRQRALAGKLAHIFRALADCCVRLRPDVLALEKTFVGRNVQSAFRLGEVRGVAMLAAAEAGIEVVEYSPAEVKVAVTGTGRAEKAQVQRAMTRELSVEHLAADAADALAVALCHIQSARLAALTAAARVAAR